MNTVYFKKNGVKVKLKINGFGDDVASELSKIGLRSMRQQVQADKDSPIMVIVK